MWCPVSQQTWVEGCGGGRGREGLGVTETSNAIIREAKQVKKKAGKILRDARKAAATAKKAENVSYEITISSSEAEGC